MGRRGAKPGNNRPVISGVLHVLTYECRWLRSPVEYGPNRVIYNRFNRWSKAGIWQEILLRIRPLDQVASFSVDSTTSKTHRCSAGGKGRPGNRRSAGTEAEGRRRSTPSSTPLAVGLPSISAPARRATSGSRSLCSAICGRLLAQSADTAYDSDAFRALLIGHKTAPVIRPNPTRNRGPPFDETRGKQRNVVERSFSHVNDWRRGATRYDNLTRNFHTVATLVAIIIRET